MAKKKRRKVYQRDLIARAQSNAKNPQRKHHLVPASYLERWERGGQLWVTDLQVRHTYRSSAGQAARETDFYRIEDEAIDPHQLPPLIMETMLGDVEGASRSLFDALIEGGVDELSADERATVTLFIALQYVRGRRNRAEMQTGIWQLNRAMLSDVRSEEDVRRRHGHDLPDERVREYLGAYDEIRAGNLRAQLPESRLIVMVGEGAMVLGEHFLARDWVVYNSDSPLITTDEPVVPVGGALHPRGLRGGPGLAGAVLLPLSPHRLLVMFDPAMELDDDALDPDLSYVESSQVNLEMLASAHRWRFSRGLGATAPHVPSLPPPVPHSIVEDAVPVRNRVNSVVHHTFVPSRWLYAPDHPLPVTRWWVRDSRPPIGGNPSPWVPPSGVYERTPEERARRAADAD